MARKQMEDFICTKVAPDSPDFDYYFRVRGVVLSLGSGITRRKLLYLKELEEAKEFRRNELERYQMARNDVFWKHVAFRASLSGGIGFMLMQTVLAFAQVKVSPASQTALNDASIAPSVLVALVFVGITKVLTQKIDDSKLTDIYKKYDWLIHQAQLNYGKGKLAEFTEAETDLRRLWHEYTGKKPPRTTTFAAVLEEDIHMLEEWLSEREEISRNIIQRVRDKALELWTTRRERRAAAKAAEARQEAEIAAVSVMAATDPPPGHRHGGKPMLVAVPPTPPEKAQAH